MHETVLQQFARRLNRAIARLRRARAGSVLILVIALLVLMTLVGTAFISTARVDRYSATQNTYNTQVDLFAQGMLDVAQGAMLRKLQGVSGVFRQGSSAASSTPGAYTPWESSITDLYLADRAPGPLFVSMPVNNSQLEVPLSYTAGVAFAGNNPAFPLWTPWDPNSNPRPDGLTSIGSGNSAFPIWMHITAPLNATSANPTGQFEAPYAVDWTNKPVQGPVLYTMRDQVMPWAIAVPQPDGSTKICPAFVVTPLNQNLLLADGVTPATLPIVVLAADTDGDGIADAGFMRLGGGQVEGATYYGAVRIIDNSSAFNASIAMQINPYPPPGKSVPGDLFPTNIDLQDMARDPLGALNAYRFNNGSANNGANFNPQPIDDTGVAHTDFAFSTPYEALWTQLGSRLNNPGYNASTSNRYQAVPLSEGMNLAYHFCLANPNIVSTSPSLLESFLPNSTRGSISDHAPYPPGSVGTWFQDQFYYNPSGDQNTALRPSLVVRNPVSNFTPTWFNDQGIYGNAPLNGAANYLFGDRVQFTDTNTGQMRGFVCIQPHPAGSQAPMNGTAYNNAYWAAMPWASHPTKINANTGTFGQLWTAYWSVMQDSPDANGVYPGGGVAQLDTDPGSNPPTNNLTHQFRSPIRSASVPPNVLAPSVPALTRSQVIQLRSALAAVNTIDMRDGDTDITSRTIRLVDTAGNNPLYANVYGAERQPYFSALLIDYEPSSPNTPYVVVELYNPHPVPIRMTGWKLASLTRSGGTISLKEVGDLSTTLQNATHAGGQTGAVILPGEKIVLQNNPALQPANIAADWTINHITSYFNHSTTGANLDAAVGNELVLLRPRVSPVGATPPATPASNSAPENTYNESNLIDLVPLDNLDLVGVGPSSAGAQQAQRYRYARANLITNSYNSAAWHCVYPGPYNLGNPVQAGASSPAFPFHHIGLLPVLATGTQADNGNFGRANGLFQTAPTPTSGNTLSAFATYQTRPLKINSLDLAGPNRPYAEALTGGLPNGSVTAGLGTTMTHPVGGFARRGDLLEVPFIGSYVISSTPDPSASGARVYEMNSVTMDSVYAQFQPPATNIPLLSSYDQDLTYASLASPPYSPLIFHNEQIGHFCPMSVGGNDFNDNPADPNFATNIKSWTYHWAKGLFDYLDVFTPQDAYLPNIDPAVTSAGASGDPSVQGSSVKYPGAAATPLPVPMSSSPVLPVKQLTGQAQVQQLQGLQDTAAPEGQININTASWSVMSAIPFFTPDIDPNNYTDDNLQLAIAIWQGRESANGNGMTPTGSGPYRSIFDIMKVNGGPSYTSNNFNIYTVFQQVWALDGGYDGGYNGDAFSLKDLSPGETNNEYGNFSPFVATFPTLGAEQPATPGEADPTDHVFGDVKSRFLGFSRISNLITTRSDSFTVYAQVQAWQNIGTPTPTPIATRRVAMLFDRSQVKPVRYSPSAPVTLTPAGVTHIPND